MTASKPALNTPAFNKTQAEMV